MKKLCLFTWLLFLFGVSAFAQVGGSGTANTIAKFTASTTIGNSGITDNGTTVSTGEAVSLTGTSYPNLFHEPVSYTALVNTTQPSAGAWQIFRGTTAAPIGGATGVQDIFAEIVGTSASATADPTTAPAAVRAFALQAAGTKNSFAIQGICQANTGGNGTGCIAIHGQANANAASIGPFAGWFQLFDQGFALLGAASVEIDTNLTGTSRSYGNQRALNVTNSVGSGTTAGSSGDPSNDWGVLIEGFGNGLVLSPALDASTGGFAAYTRNLIRIRNTGGTTGNPQTTILNFEGSQPAAFNYGLDFRNATFNNTGGCCAIIEASSTLNQLGKIGNVSGSNNVAGVISFSAASVGSATFTNAYNVAPICVATSGNTPGTAAGPWVSPSTTGVQVNFSANVTMNVNYICVANPN